MSNNTIFEVSITGRNQRAKLISLNGKSNGSLTNLFSLIGGRAKTVSITADKSEACGLATRLAELFKREGVHGEIAVTQIYGGAAESRANSLVFQA